MRWQLGQKRTELGRNPEQVADDIVDDPEREHDPSMTTDEAGDPHQQIIEWGEAKLSDGLTPVCEWVCRQAALSPLEAEVVSADPDMPGEKIW